MSKDILLCLGAQALLLAHLEGFLYAVASSSCLGLTSVEVSHSPPPAGSIQQTPAIWVVRSLLEVLAV